MYRVVWDFPEKERNRIGFPCLNSDSHTLPLVQQKLYQLREKYPKLDHWIVDENGKEVEVEMCL